MKAAAEKKWPQRQLFRFFILNYACFVLPAFSRRATAKNWKKNQCLPRLVSLAQRRLVRLDATASLISFAVRRGSPGGRSIPRYCRFASSLNFAFFDFVVNRFRCEEPFFRRFYTWPKTLGFSIFIPSVLLPFLRTLPGWAEIRKSRGLPYLRISV